MTLMWQARTAGQGWTGATPQKHSRERQNATMPSRPPSRVELVGVENGHVAVHEFSERTGILGDQLRGGVEPFLFVVTEIESRGDGIHGVGNNCIAGRQRFPSNGVIHECRRAGWHAVGHDELVRGIEHFRAVIKPLVDDGFNRVVVLGFNGGFKLRRAGNKFADVALVTAAKRHHVNFLAVRPDNSEFPG